MNEFKYEIGEIVQHILTDERFLIIARFNKGGDLEYRCRNREYRSEEFYEFELKEER